MFLLTILSAQTPPKKSSQLIEKGVASDKFAFTVKKFWQNCDLGCFFCQICEYLWGNVQIWQCFHSKKHQKTITGFLGLESSKIRYNKISHKIVI